MGVQINGSEGNVIATKGTYSGNVTIGGTLTYEDVTNIDSVGLVTARNGIEIGTRPGVAASISVDGNMIVSGISTVGQLISSYGTIVRSVNDNGITIAGGTASNSGANITVYGGSHGTYPDTVRFRIDGSEKARIDSSGYLIAKADIRLRRTASDNGALYFGDTNNNYIFGSDADDLITFATAGSERLRIDSAGNVNVGSATSTSGLRYFDVTNTSNAADTHGSLIRLITSNAANTGTTSVDIVKYKDGNFYINNNESSGSTHFYTGGSTRMTIASTGYITTPQQPYAVLGLTANLAVPYNTAYEVIFNSVMYDTASAYNSSNGRYTCPVVGDYLVTFDCQYTGMVNAFHLGVGVNGTNPPGGTHFDLWNHTGDSVRGDNIARVIRITATTQYISFFTYTNTNSAFLEPNRTKATIKFLG